MQTINEKFSEFEFIRFEQRMKSEQLTITALMLAIGNDTRHAESLYRNFRKAVNACEYLDLSQKARLCADYAIMARHTCVLAGCV